MTTIYFQVEFYSDSEQRWVALFAREKTSADAEAKRRDWLGDVVSRVVKVTQTTEVVEMATSKDARSVERDFSGGCK